MNPPISILLVHGDGSRVRRVSVPRWVAYATLGLGGIGVTAMAGLAGDYLAEQRALLASVQTRVGAIRLELEDWKAAHARMSQAFAPEAGAESRASDVGTTDFAREEDEVDLLATNVAEEGPRLHALEQIVSRAGDVMSRLPLRWPLRGAVNSGFGPRRSPWDGTPERHDGIDIGSPSGTPVAAPAPGTVVTAGAGGGYGNHVTIDHGNGIRSLYGHLRQIDVRVGQRVEKGQIVGLVGSTGRSTGPHLHYELLVHGRPVDPREFLLSRQAAASEP